jgi:transcriptional regulator with XRE-family HTH domain
MARNATKAHGKKAEKVTEPVSTSTARRVTAVHGEIGARLRAARLQVDMTQQELGKKLGLTFQQIQKYEKGTNRIDVNRLMQCARILNVPMEELYGDPLETKPRSDASLAFEAVLATREGAQIVKAFIGLNDTQRQFVIDIARKLPRLTVEEE